jgi:hypothetical protein
MAHRHPKCTADSADCRVETRGPTPDADDPYGQWIGFSCATCGLDWIERVPGPKPPETIRKITAPRG